MLPDRRPHIIYNNVNVLIERKMIVLIKRLMRAVVCSYKNSMKCGMWDNKV